jgi:hypothetical protein
MMRPSELFNAPATVSKGVKIRRLRVGVSAEVRLGGNSSRNGQPALAIETRRNYDAVVMPIAGHGEASKYPPITVADCRTSRFASTASQAAAE